MNEANVLLLRLCVHFERLLRSPLITGISKMPSTKYWTSGALLLLIALLGSCSVGALGKDETPGERFERAMKGLAENCSRHAPSPAETACDPLKLKPADPLATEEGRFAHAIKIPNPLPVDSGYKPGMTPEEYFNHLCKTEAGEFIYKTVDNVEGLYLMRPRQEATDYELQHLYALEDPYGYSVGVRVHPEEYFVQPAIGKYAFLEIPLPKSKNAKHEAQIRRFYRDVNAHPGRTFQTAINGQFVRVPYIVAEADVESSSARYGYLWRGVSRPHDRELGIAGGELIIIDVQTREVFAVRRGYARTGHVRNLTGVWWLTAQKCSKDSLKTDAQFIYQVLRPYNTGGINESK